MKTVVKNLIKRLPYIKGLIRRIYSKDIQINTLQEKIKELSTNIDELSGLLINEVNEQSLSSKLKLYKKKYLPNQNLNNILQINTLDNIGGAAKVAYRTHLKLLEKGYNSSLLVQHKVTEDDNVYKIERENNLKQNILDKFSTEGDYDDLYNLSGLKIKKLEIFKQADIVHIHNTYGKYFNLFALPELSALKPLIKTMHDMIFILGDWKRYLEVNDYDSAGKEFPYLNPESNALSLSERNNLKIKEKIFKYTDITMVLPCRWLEKYVKQSVLKDKEVHIIHNGIDHNLYKPANKLMARKELGLPTDKLILFFQAHSGKDNIWKGGNYLQKAYEKLNNVYDNLLFLSIGGESNIQKQNWIELPYIKDEALMAKYYSAADIFIYPSIADILPLTVLESLSSGTPVVAFKTGGISEAVLHEENGYIAKYKDIDEFIYGIKTLIENKSLLKKYSEKARKTIEEEFTLELMVNRYVTLYKEIIKRN